MGARGGVQGGDVAGTVQTPRTWLPAAGALVGGRGGEDGCARAERHVTCFRGRREASGSESRDEEAMLEELLEAQQQPVARDEGEGEGEREGEGEGEGRSPGTWVSSASASAVDFRVDGLRSALRLNASRAMGKVKAAFESLREDGGCTATTAWAGSPGASSAATGWSGNERSPASSSGSCSIGRGEGRGARVSDASVAQPYHPRTATVAGGFAELEVAVAEARRWRGIAEALRKGAGEDAVALRQEIQGDRIGLVASLKASRQAVMDAGAAARAAVARERSLAEGAVEAALQGAEEVREELERERQGWLTEGGRLRDELEGWRAAHEGVERRAAEAEGRADKKVAEADRRLAVLADEAGKQIRALQRELGGVRGQLREAERALREGEARRVEAERKACAADAEAALLRDDAARAREAEERIGKDFATKQAAWAGLEGRLEEEVRLRKKVFNELQELRGNIRVLVRVRPPGVAGHGHGHLHGQGLSGDEDLAVAFPEGCGPDEVAYCASYSRSLSSAGGEFRKLEFDHVLRPDASQEDVYAQVSPVVTSVLDGYDACIFAYGQTGTGKTWTMQGSRDAASAKGVNPRAVQELFSLADSRALPTSSVTDTSIAYAFLLSVLEVYNDECYDLLAPLQDGGGDTAAPLTSIRLGTDGRVACAGQVEVPIACAEAAEGLLEGVKRFRKQASTRSNAESSRSHLVVTVEVRATKANARTGTEKVQVSRLRLIDLAGSERTDKSGVAGDRMKEAQHINKSLSALGDVIACLRDRAAHVPFRNSTLTRLLQDSLGGGSKVLMICAASPEWDDASETVCTLKFASRVRGTAIGPAAPRRDPTAAAEVPAAARGPLRELSTNRAQDPSAAAAKAKARFVSSVAGATAAGRFR